LSINEVAVPIHGEILLIGEVAVLMGEVAEPISTLTNLIDDWIFLIDPAAFVGVGLADALPVFLYTA
jgi:hypothetical protein